MFHSFYSTDKVMVIYYYIYYYYIKTICTCCKKSTLTNQLVNSTGEIRTTSICDNKS